MHGDSCYVLRRVRPTPTYGCLHSTVGDLGVSTVGDLDDRIQIPQRERAGHLDLSKRPARLRSIAKLPPATWP